MLIAFVAVAYWPATSALWQYWIEQPYLGGHGPLVAALAIWLLYRSRARIDSMPVRPVPWALLPLVACSIATLILWKAGIQSLQVLMLPALMWLAVLAACGGSVARAAAVPISYLYFAVPAWNVLSPALQSLTVRIVGFAATLMGLPATVSGTIVSFPDGAQFAVTLACSGVGFLEQGLAVAVLIGELEDATIGRRIRLLGSMLLVAVATNWVRVLLLVLIGHVSGMNNVLVSQYHLEFGYALFVVVLVAFVWATTFAPLTERTTGVMPRANAHAWSSCIVVLAALVTGPLVLSVWSPPAAQNGLSRLVLPVGRNTWRGPLPALQGGWRPTFVGADAQLHAAYEDPQGRAIEVVAVGYSSQKHRSELVAEGNSLLGDGGLSALTSTLADVDQDTYREIVASDEEGNRSVIWWVYDIGGRTFVVPLLSRLWYGIRSISGAPYSAQFAFRAACLPSCDAARATLRQFIRGMGTQVLSAANPQNSRDAALAPRPNVSAEQEASP